MPDLRKWMRQCEHAGCDMPVVEAQEVGGRMERLTLHPEPSTWEAGARHKVASVQPNASWCNVVKLTRPGRAFGVALYLPHREVCAVKQVHRRTSEQKGGRA